jgi:integrase
MDNLLVRSATARSWLFRYTSNGKRREMGLGSASGLEAVSLDEARLKAIEYILKVKKEGRDPVQERKAERTADDDDAAKQKTFAWCAEKYIEAQQSGWKNEVHREQWSSSIEHYADPVIGNRPVREVGDDHMLRILQPLWDARKVETGMRLRGRIERILDWAARHGYRDRHAPNPARWRGHLDIDLAPKSKVRRVKPHAAMGHREIAEFMVELRQQPGIAAKALAFTILTAARTGEVIGARWSEIDLDQALWVVPAERMKAGKEHRVPLSDEAVAILHEMQPLRQEEGNYVFPGQFDGWPLSNMALLSLIRRMQRTGITTHGFRSSFRDWCGDTNQSRELAESALAHTVGGVEGSYFRSDMIERRRILMQAWSTYSTQPRPAGSNVLEYTPRHG